jgi:hypothetical protein
MTEALVVVAIIAAFAAGAIGGWWRRRPRPADRADATRRILLPFTGNEISKRALQAAVRLARAEDAVIMPAYLARVPLTLPLDAPLPLRCSEAMPMLEAIEQRVAGQGVVVDARVSRGRTERDALRRLLETEPVDRVIVSVPHRPDGLSAEDIDWMLKRVDAEVMILRPAPDDDRTLSPAAVVGHF